jgi:hypothetical protein
LAVVTDRKALELCAFCRCHPSQKNFAKARRVLGEYYYGDRREKCVCGCASPAFVIQSFKSEMVWRYRFSELLC